MFERRGEGLIPWLDFFYRQMRFVAMSAALIAVSLTVGVIGYHHFAKLGWVDSILNAAMILTGMGPVNAMTTTGGKLFASAYALFSGVVFLTSVAMLLTPTAHRLLHYFHLDPDE